MDPKHLLTPAMAGLLERIQRANRPPFQTMAPAEARAAYERLAEVLDLPRAPLATVEDFVIPGTDLKARRYVPTSGPLPTLLFMHGGGFVVGSLETHDSLCRQLALKGGCVVIALDYRLAPEHRFPAAAEDTWTALQWLASTGRPVAVGGDSAGGTLAAVAALMARDAGMTLALQLLITPGTAAETDSASYRDFGHGFLLDIETVEWFFEQSTTPSERHDWRFAPLEADDVEGVAPAAFILAECDPVTDEALAYADRLRAAGVPVGLELYRGVTHDFIKMGRALKEAVAAHDAAGAALRNAWPTTP
jgi:acetyl esterase